MALLSIECYSGVIRRVAESRRMDIGQTQSHGITKCRTDSDRVVVETETLVTEREEERW